LRLPAFNVITADLHVTDRLTKGRLDLAPGPTSPDGEQGDLVLKIDKALNDHTTTRNPTAMHRMIPGGLDLVGPIDPTLPFARTTHDGFNETGITNSACVNTLPTPFDRKPELLERIAEPIRARGQAERLRGEAPNTLTVHRQTGRACRWHHPDLAFRLKSLEFGGRDRFDFGYDQ